MSAVVENVLGWRGLKAASDEIKRIFQDLAYPGVDICFLGDSIPVVNTGNRNRDHQEAYFEKLMQGRYNPTGVPGGKGYFPINIGGATGSPAGSGGDGVLVTSASPLNFSGGDTYAQYNLAEGTAGRQMTIQAGTTRYTAILATGNNGQASYNRDFVTSFEVVGRTYNGGPTLAIEGGVGAYVARGGSSTVFSVSGPKAWDMNTADTVFGARSALIGVANRALANRLQIFGGPSGNAAYVEGWFLCDGDETAGVRVHDLCSPGSNFGSHWTEGSLKASIDAFAQGTPRRNAGVFVLSVGINDPNDAGIDVTAFKAYMETNIDRILQQPTKPVVIIQIAPRIDYTAVAHTKEKNESFRAALLEIQAERAGRVMILDLGISIGGGLEWSSDLRRRALNTFDGVHLTPVGHAFAADSLFQGFKEVLG